MTSETPISKAELLARLRRTGEEAVSKLRAIPAGAFEQGRYENGWNAREILAHMATIEWSYPRLIDMAASQPSPGPTPTATGASTGAEQSGTARGGIDDYNQRWVDRRIGVPVEELIAEFEKNRRATVAAVEAADESLFSRHVRSAGGAGGTLSQVLNTVAVQHIEGHVRDIVGVGG